MEITNNITCTGKIIKELPSAIGKTPDGRDWEKRAYVMLVDGFKETKIKFDMMSWDGPVQRLDIGKRVKLEATISSREFNGNWFTNITARGIYEPD